MHPVNAMNIAHAKTDSHSLDDTFDAIRSLSAELTRRDLPKEHMSVPSTVMKTGLTILLGRHEHSPAFQSVVYSAFNDAAAHITTLDRIASTLKYWDRASSPDRMDFCRALNSRVYRNLLNGTQIGLSETYLDKINFRENPIVPIAPLRSQEYFDVQPHASHRRERNIMRINTERLSGFSDPYRTVRNMTSATMYLFMQNMTRNAVSVGEAYKDDQRLWHRMNVNNGTVPETLERHFSAQYFRRVWDDVASRTVDQLKAHIGGATNIPEPPKRNLLQRILDF